MNKEYSTFGQQLLSIKYGSEFNKNKAYLFALLTVGSKYLKQRSHEIATAARNPTVSEKVRTMFIFFHPCIVTYPHLSGFLQDCELS